MKAPNNHHRGIHAENEVQQNDNKRQEPFINRLAFTASVDEDHNMAVGHTHVFPGLIGSRTYNHQVMSPTCSPLSHLGRE